VAIKKEFLGRGWAFPFQFDPASGAVALSEYEENIRQNITVILGTRPGERQMLPAFGCRIHELLFAPSTRRTAQVAARYVEQALRRWERRIEVKNVVADIDAGGAIRVDLTYKIISTGAVQRLQQAISGSGR